MLKATYTLPNLASLAGIETSEVLRALAVAHRHLAELKGKAAAIPNQGILIDTLALQEAQASSEIEDIVTTTEELFQISFEFDYEGSPAMKEVARYRDALRQGFQNLASSQGLLTNNNVIEMFQVLKQTTERFRAIGGTALKNPWSENIIYVPPQSHAEIVIAMTELERFINDDACCDLDPLVKMALIHHQFESIHPFSDGNGRIGRIINVLYLTRIGLLEIPILYLSKYITENKSEYYRLLQAVRETGAWEEWVLYMLRGVAETSKRALALVEGIRVLMHAYKQRMRSELGSIYSQDLLNNLFRHPYTRIDYVQAELNVTRQTAAKYLEQLAAAGFVRKAQIWRTNYYINQPLFDLFSSTEQP